MLNNHETKLLLTLLTEGSITDGYAADIEGYELYCLEEYIESIQRTTDIEFEKIEFLDSTELEGPTLNRVLRLSPENRKKASLVLQGLIEHYQGYESLNDPFPDLDLIALTINANTKPVEWR